MKKIKYRNNSNNYNNQVYSINYKFDSLSPAGKCSGTALDLIKRYNELAKEAHGNGDYVEAEVFRQYAEHYRKIVTEINERKNVRLPVKENALGAPVPEAQSPANEEGVETMPAEQNKAPQEASLDNGSSLVETKAKAPQKAFTVIEITENEARPKRPYYRKNKNFEPSSAIQG